MLINALILYYIGALVYSVIIFVLRRKGAVLQFMILISCPFLGVLLVAAMFKKPAQNGELPEWLLRREQYEDVSLQTPDRETEANVIPFRDALTLNENAVKRKTLIHLLKQEFLHQSEALSLALMSDDTETSHYAATALQQAKSQLVKELKQLEEELQKEEAGVPVFKRYVHVLKQSVEMEFLDERTRQKYKYAYLQALNQLLAVNPQEEPLYFTEKIEAALDLEEFQDALDTADQFLAQYPSHEDAYFAAMNVHFRMRNEAAFFQLVDTVRLSSIRLSPERLNQLRYWLQGDRYESKV